MLAAGVGALAAAGWPTNCWGDAMLDHLNFRDVVLDQSHHLCSRGFTERQARFLATVMAHSGVFVERQYCRFAGVAHGQKSHDFIHRLVGAGFAREERPGRLNQGRLFHVHHKRLYTLIGQADNRHRRRAPRSRMMRSGIADLVSTRWRRRGGCTATTPSRWCIPVVWRTSSSGARRPWSLSR